jgi:aryl-alcohol dehydrogenase-like predicted oxidoreductase
LLDAVVDHGFLHFDTAPYYGFGVAERDLAPVLRAHPEIKVTTKVGIYSPGGEDQPDVAVFLRKLTGRFLPAASTPETSFDLRRAERCLHDSLRRLGREHVDLYMLHEPRLDQLNADVWLGWLEAQQRTGRIGLFGLALTAERLAPFLDQAQALTGIVQVLDSLAGREADVLTDRGRPLQITYGYLSAAQAAGDTTPVPDLLRRAARRNPHGPIIVSTRRPERLAQFARADEAIGD